MSLGPRQNHSSAKNDNLRSLYTSKLVHLGVIDAELPCKGYGPSEHQTAYAAVAQLNDKGRVVGIFAIPLDMSNADGEDGYTRHDLYDVDDLWETEQGVYYLGKTLRECRHNEWKLVSKGKIEVICLPEE
jgi:hypothetical protein